MGNISSDGKLDLSQLKYLPSSHRDFPGLLLEKGDLLFNRTNSAELVGKTLVYKGVPFPCSFASYLIRVRLGKGVLPDLVAAFLNGPLGRSWIKTVVNQTVGQANVNGSKLSSFSFPLPPLGEQRRIVDALDELLSDLDAGVESLRQAQAKLNFYRIVVLKAAVEGRLTADWRKHNSGAESASELLKRILVERRRLWEEKQLGKFTEKGKRPPKNRRRHYREALTPDIANLPPLPENWCWVTLDQLAAIAGGVTKGQTIPSGAKVRRVPYLRVANVQRGFLNLQEIKEIAALEADIKALTLEPGDILFNEGGDRDKLGRGWIWEGQIQSCIHQNHVFRARLFLKEVQPKLVSWCGNSYGQEWFLRAGKQSVNLASINLNVLRSFPLPLAPVEEQQAIVELVEEQLSVVDHWETDLQTKVGASRALRQSILHRAFTGQLVPQDPTDEPAEEILKRIAAERTQRSQSASVRKAKRT